MHTEDKHIVTKVLDGIQWIIENICAIIFLGLIIPPFIQIITRELFGFALVWSDELARYCGIWMIMLGAAVLFRTHEHVNLDLLLVKFPSKLRYAVEVFIQLVCIAVMAYFMYYSVVLMKGTMSHRSTAMHIPMAYVYSGVVLGSFLCVVFSIEALVRFLRHRQFMDGNQCDAGCDTDLDAVTAGKEV